nr:SDR family NAD(P)-dependent oxidoreductase [Halomicronema sp. CCY15110]
MVCQRFFLTQTVVKNMVGHGHGGAIVNLGSMWAKQAVQATPSSAYAMAKAALHFLIQHLAMELASAMSVHNFRVMHSRQHPMPCGQARPTTNSG